MCFASRASYASMLSLVLHSSSLAFAYSLGRLSYNGVESMGVGNGNALSDGFAWPANGASAAITVESDADAGERATRKRQPKDRWNIFRGSHRIHRAAS